MGTFLKDEKPSVVAEFQSLTAIKLPPPDMKQRGKTLANY